MNIGVEDIEHYLLNHLEVFANLVYRHRGLLLGQLQDILAPNQQNDNRDGIDDAEVFRIPHLHVGMRVNRQGILFTPLDSDEDEGSDVEMGGNTDDSSDDDADELAVPHMNVEMRVDAQTIQISRLEPDD